MSSPAWDNVPALGLRLNRLIKYSETMLKKTDKDDHDGKSRYISNIVTLTRQQLEIIKLNEEFEKIDAWFSALEKDKIAINKQRLRQIDKQNKEEKQDIQNQKEREKQEIHDELVSKRHTQEMRI